MLAIRMQRTGRKGHAQFRVVVQDSRLSPTSGRVVAQLGSYNPHAKALILDKEKAELYLKNGAQPSDRIARLFKNEGVDLPKWVTILGDKERTIRNAEKLRKNQPAKEAEPAAEAEAVAAPETEPVAEVNEPAEEVAAPEETVAETAEPVEEPAEAAPVAEQQTEQKVEESAEKSTEDSAPKA